MGFDPHVVMNQMQSFESNPELFNLTAGMEMLAFPSKNRDGNFISKAIINESTNDFFQTEFHKPDFAIGFSETNTEDLIVAPDSSGLDNNIFLPDNSSLRCVFPCEGNERPSKGLSLSMCSDKHSSIGIESFELRETTTHRKNIQPNQGFFSKSTNFQRQQEILKDEFVGKSLNLRQTHLQLKNSKYLAPAQELLTEFCSIGTKQTDRPNKKPHKFNQWEEENGGHESKTVLLNSLDLLQLQKRKTKLISMLEEVDRRYSQYCDQMKAVVSSLEAVVGTGAATVYSASALKAMSKHFRCLRDGIVGQVKATNKAIEDKDHPVAPGTSRGETPRLRLLDQTLRQQKAFQQMRMMDSPPWRSQRGLPERSVSVLRAWLFEHFLHPYPSDVDKLILARQTGLSRSQVSNWFINARVRLWKPMVEEMYLEETKEQDNLDSSDGIADLNYHKSQTNIQNPFQDHKPTAHEPLVRRDSDSLSSIVNNPEEFDDVKDGSSHYHQQHQHRQFGSDPAGIFGVMDVDYSTYNNQDHTSNAVFHNGVSLTLGLQQHGRSGVNSAFSPPSQHSLFIPRVHIEDCDEQVDDQYSMLNGEPQNLPYRKLMGTQLLHDMAG